MPAAMAWKCATYATCGRQSYNHGSLFRLFLGIPLQRQQWFALSNGSISALRLVADPVAERPNYELLPPVEVEVYCVNERRHLVK